MPNKSTGIVIQARRGSSRSPDKILKPFYQNQTVLEYLLSSLLTKFPAPQIVIATTLAETDKEIELVADKFDIKVFKGDEADVLKRTINAAEKFNFSSVIRVCSDNPFLSPETISELMASAGNADYVSYATADRIPSIKTHFGFFAEYATLPALKTAHIEAESQSDLEHVTQYLYSNPGKFEIKYLALPYDLDNYKFLRCALDDKTDLQNLAFIADALKGDTRIDKIIKFVMDNPSLKSSMESQIKKYTK